MMERAPKRETSPEGWDWFELGDSQDKLVEEDDIVRSFARCFKGGDGAIVIGHLRQSILDRRLSPAATDAELRFLEGQRTVVAHILSMVDRGLS